MFISYTITLCIYYHRNFIFLLIGATPDDKRSTPKQMFDGKQYKKEADWLFNNIVAYAEFPPIVPPVMAKAYTGERKLWVPCASPVLASECNGDILGLPSNCTVI